jgi:hypothetical protein
MKLSPVNKRRGFSSFAPGSTLKSLPGTSQATLLNSTSRLVWRWLASKSIPAELTAVRVSIAASWPIIAMALLMRAFDLPVRAFAPRCSHSISVFTLLRRLSC